MDDSRIVSCDRDHTIIIWNTKDYTLHKKLDFAHSDWITSICFSPDGKKFVSGSLDRTLVIWDN
jgi:WD40 repeat protein